MGQPWERRQVRKNSDKGRKKRGERFSGDGERPTPGEDHERKRSRPKSHRDDYQDTYFALSFSLNFL